MLASRLFRSAFVLLPMMAAAAWAGGCSDDAFVDPVGPDGGPDKATGSGDAGDKGDGGVVVDPRCATDLDVDKLYKHLSCTGLYSNFTTKEIATDAMPYKPSTEFWSDGAEKSRWMYLPPNTKIDTSDMNEWVFPVGTKAWKQFKVGGKLVETRLFTKTADGWLNATYRWNADETDATRLDDGEKVPGVGPDGGVYEIPTQQDCASLCHGGRKDSLLGFDAVSLGLPNATGLTLSELVDKKLLTVDPPVKTLAYPAATAAQGGDKAGPALQWLNINCASACHNQNPNAGALFSGLFMQMKATDLMPGDAGGPLAVDKVDTYAHTVCVKSNQDEQPPNSGSMKYVRPGVPGRSWVSIVSGRRSEDEGTLQMPPFNTHTHAVDVNGHKLLDDWIAAMTVPCTN